MGPEKMAESERRNVSAEISFYLVLKLFRLGWLGQVSKIWLGQVGYGKNKQFQNSCFQQFGALVSALGPIPRKTKKSQKTKMLGLRCLFINNALKIS